jgi:hypothetical protein
MRACCCGFFTTCAALWFVHLLKYPAHDERSRYVGE